MKNFKKTRNFVLVILSLFILGACQNTRTFKVTWKNDDGSVLLVERNLVKGTMPNYPGETPTKSATDEFVYHFDEWSPALAPIVGNITYTATYTKSLQTYKLTFLNDDDSVLAFVTAFYGTTARYSGARPVKADTNEYAYNFTGWEPELGIVTGDMTYKAQYTSVEKFPITVTLDGLTTLYYITKGSNLAFLNDVSDAYHLLSWYSDPSHTIELSAVFLANYNVQGPLALYGETSFQPYEAISYNKRRMEWDRQRIYPVLNYVITNVAVSYNLPAKLDIDTGHNSSLIIATNAKYVYYTKNIVFDVIDAESKESVPFTLAYDYKGFQVIEFSVIKGGLFYLTCTYLYHDYDEYVFNITGENKK